MGCALLVGEVLGKMVFWRALVGGKVGNDYGHEVRNR